MKLLDLIQILDGYEISIYNNDGRTYTLEKAKDYTVLSMQPSCIDHYRALIIVED